MQPRFPTDHHFHDHHRGRPRPRVDDAEIRAAVDHLIRHCLPTFDPSDPRS